jgi:glucose/arabinose dehydrogenase
MSGRGSSPMAMASVLATIAVMLALPLSAAAEPALPAGFQDEVAIPKIEQPTNIEFAPDGRVFVAQKPGRIVVFDSVDDTSAETFADLRTQVYDRGDRGLLGLALDPDFDSGRPYVYALYTYDHILGDPNPAPKWGTANTTGDPCPDNNGGDACLASGRLVRLTAEGNHAAPTAAAPTQIQLLEGWCQQFSSHSVGDLRFGPEGALYVSGGDGASFSSADYGQFGNPVPNPCGDPPGGKGVALTPPTAEGGALRSQNLKVLNGKILRIDPDTGAALPSNPLASSPDANTKRIVASGFRNPFRFEFDSKTGEIYVANVGSSELEEIDRFQVPPTSLFNSGWPCYEGLVRHFQYRNLGLNACESLYNTPGSTTQAFFYYSHGQLVVPNDECPRDFGSALGGVEFYEGDEFPSAYDGAFFFADSVRGCVWVMFPGGDGRPDPSTATRFLREDRIYPAIDIEEGPDGFLYYTDLVGYEPASGSIHRIFYEPGAPKARLTANPPYGTTLPLSVTFDATGSSDPTDEALTYDWDLDGDGDFELEDSTATKTVEYTQAELDEREDNDESLNPVVAVRVTDGEGLTSVARVTVYPGDSPPQLEVNKPLTSQKWSVGDKIELFATGKDSKGADITTPLSYYWTTETAHCPTGPEDCHNHPLQTFSGLRSSSFLAPEHDYPSHLNITVSVADARGLTTTKTIALQPRTVDLSLETSPPGIEITAGLSQGPAPLLLTGIDGSQMLLSVPESAAVGDRPYTFDAWSDGGARVHTITIDEATSTYRATYTTPGEPEPKTQDPPSEPIATPSPGESPAPVTLIRRHPRAQTMATTAKFVFGADITPASFRCKLDGKPKAACASPKTYKKLKAGRHTFKVWATAGVLTDPTPAKFSWKILPPKR